MTGSGGVDRGEPVFAEPWEAQVFAMAVRLSEAGHFTWAEWTQALAAEIGRAGAGAECRPVREGADPSEYYRRWLAALEALLERKGLVGATEIERRTEAWLDAAARTPHGEPIRLARDARERSG